MFKRRRSEIDIIKDILSLSEGGAKRTHIIYKCNMSFTQFKRYIEFLSNNNYIIRQKTDGRKYHITKDGEHFLKDINKITHRFEQ